MELAYISFITCRESKQGTCILYARLSACNTDVD